MEPKEIIQSAIDKLNNIESAGELSAAIPDLTNILVACMMVDDLTNNGFGLAIVELSKAISGNE